jgi:hypothetical protein
VNARHHADRYAEIGLRVVPIKAGEKMPAVSRWVQVATTDPAQIDAWWPAGTTNGVGIVTGKQSGIFALDVDINDNIDGGATLDGLEESYGKLPATWTSVTGSGGYHYLFAYPNDFELRNNASTKLGPGLDIRGEGGQIVAPPSVHANNYAYQWDTGCAPWECELAEAPDWLLAMLRPDEKPAEPPQPAPATASNLQNLHRSDDGDKPGDHFNNRHTGDEVLLRNGWTLHHVDNTGTHYTRPGKDRRDGPSATVYANDGHTTIWSTTVDGVEVERPYDPFGLVAFLEHRGNFDAATRELRRQGYGGERSDGIEIAAGLATVSPLRPTSNEGGADEGAPLAETTWEPVDIEEMLTGDWTPIIPEVWTYGAGTEGVFYTGRMNALWGDSGSGKSWVALAACASEMNAGRGAVYIDLEDHPRSVINRLILLGVTTATIRGHFHYVHPDLHWTEMAAAQLATLIRSAHVGVVVVDSVGEAMAVDGAKPNDDDDVARWYRNVPRFLADLGCAVILIDHVPKSKEAAKGFAIGSQRKRAAIDGVAWMVESKVAPTRERDGHLVLETAKDRNGHYRNGGVEFDVEIANVAGKVRVDAKRHDPNQLPTVLMERVSRYLEEEGPQSKNTIASNVQGKTEAVRRAVDELAKLGNVTITGNGGRGGVKFELAQIYRNPVDNDPWGPLPSTIAPPAPKARPRTEGRDSSTPEKKARPPRPGIHTDMPGRGALSGDDDQGLTPTGTEPRPTSDDLF